MAVYIRIFPGLKVRVSKRGLRWSPRAASGPPARRGWRSRDLYRGRMVDVVQAAAAAQQKITMRR